MGKLVLTIKDDAFISLAHHCHKLILLVSIMQNTEGDVVGLTVVKQGDECKCIPHLFGHE